MKNGSLRTLSTLLAAALLAALFTLPAGAQGQERDWREEFEAVCVKTDLALSLSSEELAELIARCDRLAERIGAESEVVRKVSLKRLQSCRALFAYILETRGGAPGAGSAAVAPSPASQPATEQPPAAPSAAEQPTTGQAPAGPPATEQPAAALPAPASVPAPAPEGAASP